MYFKRDIRIKHSLQTALGLYFLLWNDRSDQFHSFRAEAIFQHTGWDFRNQKILEVNDSINANIHKSANFGAIKEKLTFSVYVIDKFLDIFETTPIKTEFLV